MNPRDYGHTGVCITHVCFDGALHSILTRRTKQHLAKATVERSAQVRGAGLDPRTLALQEWAVSTQRCAHACHNGLKWGLGEVFKDQEKQLKLLWQVFAGLQNSSSLLHKNLPIWLGQRLHFCPCPHTPHS